MIIIGVTSWNETGSSTKDVKEISRDRLQVDFILIRSSANQKVSRINMKILFRHDDYHTKYFKAIFSQSQSIFQNNLSYVTSNYLVIKNYKKGQ